MIHIQSPFDKDRKIALPFTQMQQSKLEKNKDVKVPPSFDLSREEIELIDREVDKIKRGTAVTYSLEEVVAEELRRRK